MGNAQPPLVHASQQLGRCPTQACPRLGGLHAAALGLMLHLVAPLASVRQQVTNPGFPQVDRAAQTFAARRQALGKPPALTAALATRAAHLTYAP